MSEARRQAEVISEAIVFLLDCAAMQAGPGKLASRAHNLKTAVNEMLADFIREDEEMEAWIAGNSTDGAILSGATAGGPTPADSTTTASESAEAIPETDANAPDTKHGSD